VFTQYHKNRQQTLRLRTPLQLRCLFITDGNINQISKVCVNSSLDICFTNFSSDYEEKVCLSFLVNVGIRHFKSWRSCLNNLRESFKKFITAKKMGLFPVAEEWQFENKRKYDVGAVTYWYANCSQRYACWFSWEVSWSVTRTVIVSND
jgi:hypothetical protein